MREHFFKIAMAKFSAPFLLVAAIVALAGCSDNTSTISAAPPPGTTVTVGSISLSTSVTSIMTDNSNSATLTATVTDASNAVLPGVTVTFATTSGNLSATTAISDSTGKAIVTLTSGASDFSNRTATITATAGGLTATIPVLINGSTLTLSVSAGAVQVGAGTITLAANAKDAGGIGKNGQTIRFSIGATSTGTATLSATTLTTGVTGATANVTLTPNTAGTVVVTADWLDSSGAVSVTATQSITVTAAAGIAFAITTPAVDPAPMATGAMQTLAVTVPTNIGNEDTNGNLALDTEDTNGNGVLDAGEDANGNGTLDTEDTNGNGVLDLGLVTTVRISSSAGTWQGTAPATGPAASITQTPAANAVSATFTAPGNSGVVAVQVDALDTNGVVLSTLSRTFAVSAPAASAASISLQTSASTIAPSSGTNTSTATLTATVRDAAGNSVGGAAVMFELLGTTGSGESISPTVAYTDSLGKVTATFSAGSVSTLGPIYIRARVVGEVCTGSPQAIPVVAETNALCNSAPLIVASTAVSISLGFGTFVSDTANATQYLLPGSVLVVNANGSAVAGATVTLTVFPFQYRNGTITSNATGCVSPLTSFVASEDVNRNGILDPGEDTPLAQSAAQIAAGAISNNGVLSPPQAAGGAIPVTVTTDSNGAATFELQYPKSSAWFIRDEVTARVMVAGTERSAQTSLYLPMSATDAASPCALARTADY